MWPLNFIAETDLRKHLKQTIEKYGEKLQSIDLHKFNKNIIDPVKLLFDKTVYGLSWNEILSNEIFRQRDKANNNDIGYFHQGIFKYIQHCRVPENGREGGWDIIYCPPEGVLLPTGDRVSRIFVELKNKHNTMNSASAGKTFMKMQSQLLKDDSCACFLVETIAAKSQNIKWDTSVDGQKVSHKLIRRVSMDKFYALLTNQEDAFFQLCMLLPGLLKETLESLNKEIVPKDTVLQELEKSAKKYPHLSADEAIAMACYMLGFGEYLGFSDK